MGKGTAVVVGGSGGIGRHCARELIDAGFDVVLVARDAARLERTADEIGAHRWVAADSADEHGAERIAAEVDEVTVLIAGAGVNTEPTALRDTSVDAFDAVIRANLRSTFLLIRAVLPKMVVGGRMIFVSSTSAARGLSEFGPYAASKGGLRALAGSLAGEAVAEGVNVSVLTPGPVDTSMFDTGPANVPLLDPRDVGRAARYLADLPPSVTVDELVLRANRRHSPVIS